MATIRIAIDNIQNYSADKKTLDKVAELLRQGGHTVTTHGVGPNTIQGVMRKSSNKCDIAIQIAGGKCLGTLCDFWVGSKPGGYYNATKMGFAYFKCWSATWPAKREPRDHFSTKPGPVKVEADKMTGKTLPEIFKIYKDRMVYGYGETAEDCAKTLLASISGQAGGGESTKVQIDTGNSILDLITQVMSDWKGYGAELTLTGDTVNIKRSNPNTATPLTTNNIINNSVSMTDYDNSTPNTYGKIKDDYLIKRFGVITLEKEEINSTWESQVLQIAQGGHGHTIELKAILNPAFIEGKWVKLTYPPFNIFNRDYYILKSGLEDERVMSLTLSPAPPERFIEVTETTDEVIDGTETTDEEATT